MHLIVIHEGDPDIEPLSVDPPLVASARRPAAATVFPIKTKRASIVAGPIARHAQMDLT